MKPPPRTSARSAGAPPRERKTLWAPMKRGAVDRPPRGAIRLLLARAKGVPAWAPSVLGGIRARRRRGIWGQDRMEVEPQARPRSGDRVDSGRCAKPHARGGGGGGGNPHLPPGGAGDAPPAGDTSVRGVDAAAATSATSANNPERLLYRPRLITLQDSKEYPSYKTWLRQCHGEADRVRDEVVRQRIEEYDADVGVGDMLNDYHEAHFNEGCREECDRHNRLSVYTSAAREVHGPEYNLSTRDQFGEVLMRVGVGKKHGRYYIGDDTLDTATSATLSQIRAMSKSSNPAIRPQPDTVQFQIKALQAQLIEERRKWEVDRQDMEAQLRKWEVDQQNMLVEAHMMGQHMQEMFQYYMQIFSERMSPPAPLTLLPPPPTTTSVEEYMIQMCQYVQNLSERMGLPAPPMLFPRPPPTTTPNQSTASNDGPHDPDLSQ